MSEKIEIFGGPSAEELFLALRLSKERRKVEFKIRVIPETGDPLEAVFPAHVHSIGCKNINDETWNVEIFFPEMRYHANGINKFLPRSIRAIYSTQTRVGPVQYEKVSNLTPVEDVDISVRLYNILIKAGIFYVQKLKDWSKKEMEELKFMGKTMFNELETVMKERGVSFKEN